jgi:hypothetical protein
MDITGKLFAQLEEVGGQGKNGPWKKRNFVIETGDKYPKKVCLTAWGEQADQVAGFTPGVNIKVSFDLESREYNGKWYTDAKAWKIESQGGGGDESYSQSPAYADAESLPPPPAGGDDLPF